MRKIEEMMVNAVINARNMRVSNTEVEVDANYIYVRLWGHTIYKKNRKNGKEAFSSCGYWTNTTKSRLNALGASIHQKDWAWYNEDGTPFKDGNMFAI